VSDAPVHASYYTLHPYIALVNCGHLLHMRIDHAEPEFEAEQVQWVFGGPQASSCEDANIVVIKASPGASNHLP
jgi:hypothetical protein